MFFLFNARAVADFRYLFWNDQGTGKIERSLLDGSDRIDFVFGAVVELPNQMAVYDE